MGNVFASPFPIDEQYDLKGSKVNRWVEVEQITPQIALKDLNFNKILKLGSRNKALFLEQLERDCKVLFLLLLLLFILFLIIFNY